MALAIWGGIMGFPIVIDAWVLIGLMGGSILTSIARRLRRGSLVSLRGSSLLALWLVTRFVIAPAFILILLAWLVCAAFGFAAADPLMGAFFLVLFYGGPLIFVTSALTDIAAAINGPVRKSPSGS
jgi:hypothetical protein